LVQQPFITGITGDGREIGVDATGRQHRVTPREGVEHRHLMANGKKPGHEKTADISGATSHENPHNITHESASVKPNSF
jgi:hypothetical protein